MSSKDQGKQLQYVLEMYGWSVFKEVPRIRKKSKYFYVQTMHLSFRMIVLSQTENLFFSCRNIHCFPCEGNQN